MDASQRSEHAQAYFNLLQAEAGHAGNPSNPHTRLDELRQLILLESLPTNPEAAAAIRPLVWKLLLRLHVLPASSKGGIHPLMVAETYVNLM